MTGQERSWSLRVGDRVSVGSVRAGIHRGVQYPARGVVVAFDTVPGVPGVKVALDRGQGAAAAECYATYAECRLLDDGDTDG